MRHDLRRDGLGLAAIAGVAEVAGAIAGSFAFFESNKKRAHWPVPQLFVHGYAAQRFEERRR